MLTHELSVWVWVLRDPGNEQRTRLRATGKVFWNQRCLVQVLTLRKLTLGSSRGASSNSYDPKAHLESLASSRSLQTLPDYEN